MANRKRIHPLLVFHPDVLSDLQTHFELCQFNIGKKLYAAQGYITARAFAGKVLKARLGLPAAPYLHRAEYIAGHEKYRTFSRNDVSLCKPLVPIRDDSEMVSTTGLLGVAAARLRQAMTL